MHGQSEPRPRPHLTRQRREAGGKPKHANQLEHPNASEQPPFRKQKKQLCNISKSKERHANQLEHPNADEQPPFQKQKKQL